MAERIGAADLMTISQQIKKYVIGKKITKIKLNRFGTGVMGNPFSYDPTITLDDGTEIRFVVNETEVGEYGIEPVIVPPRK